MRFENDPKLTPVNMEFYRTSYVSGSNQSDRLKVGYFFRREDGRLFAEIESGKNAEGPPGLVHGGAMAAILDEAMGVMAWFNRHSVVTANLSVNFRQPLPLGKRVILETWLESVEGKKIRTYGEIRSEEAVYADARGLFVKLPLDSFVKERETLSRQYGV